MKTMLTVLILAAVAAFANSLPVEQDTPTPTPLDSYLLYQPDQLPIGFLPPKPEEPAPFYPAEPATVLTAPKESLEPNFYQVPIPSQELLAPTETDWNPDNDPKFYYELPVALSKQEVPTKEHPKKYNQDIHLKKKPYSARPKQELVLEPIDAKQYEQKQRTLEKTYLNLAKKQNKLAVDAEKARQDV